MKLVGAKPERKLVFVFLAAIAAGTILLYLPISSAGPEISLVDALFTSTSATCVTGLIVLDTGSDFSLFGQIVIVLLIQVGGLGIMTFATVILLSFAPGLSLHDRLTIDKTLGSGRRASITSILKSVMIVTFTLEAMGAVVLFFKFLPDYPPGEAAFHAVFHAVSAFCNAGFSTFSTSLEGYVSDPVMISIFSVLIVTGGLGFVVIGELAGRTIGHTTRLSLHTKLCLSATVVLLALGTIAFFVAEDRNVLAGMNPVDKFMNAFFQSITSRTAGFNTVAQMDLSEVSLLVTVILMFIGACPGSTGGGVKTTTAAILFLLAWHRFRGRQSARAFQRSISTESIIRAAGLVLISTVVIVTLFVVIMFSEDKPANFVSPHGWFIEHLFEVVSAFGTVGLSMGATGQLNTLSKLVIVVLMFVGRVGLLTIVMSLAAPARHGEVTYIDERVMVG